MAFIDKLSSPEFRLNLPLYVGGKSHLKKDGTYTKTTKKHWLNLNNYRNWHYQTASSTKIKFKEEVRDQIEALPNLTDLWGPISFHYLMYPPNMMQRDLMNVATIIDKYFMDALVEMGKLKDDNCSFVPGFSCEVRYVDRTNPRMEVGIRPFISNPGAKHGRNINLLSEESYSSEPKESP